MPQNTYFGNNQSYPSYPSYPTQNVQPYIQPYMYNPYGTAYNPYYQNNVQPQNQTSVQSQSVQNQMTPPTIHADIIQIEGYEQVKDYNMAAGCTQMFMTKDEQNIFIKSVFANNTDDIVTYTRSETPVENVQNDFVTREEFERRLADISYKPKYEKSNYKKNNSYKKEDEE